MYNVHTFCAFLYVRQCAFYMSKTQLSLTSVLAICTNRSLGLQVRHRKMSHAELILTDKKAGVSRPGGIISRGRVGVSYSG